MQGFVRVSQNFVFRPVLYVKPLKLRQNECYVIIARRSGILDGRYITCLELSFVHQSEEHCNSLIVRVQVTN